MLLYRRKIILFMPHGCAAFFIRGGFLKNEGQGMVTGMA